MSIANIHKSVDGAFRSGAEAQKAIYLAVSLKGFSKPYKEYETVPTNSFPRFILMWDFSCLNKLKNIRNLR
jgi:hypothetical protein